MTIKHLFLSLTAAATLCGAASAQTLSVADVEALPGETVDFALTINVEGGTYSGFQFQMQFPSEGFATVGATIASDWDGGSLGVGDLVAGEANASASSMSDSAIPDGERVIGTVKFSVGSDVPTGNYDVTISNFNFLDGTNYTPVDDVTFTVKVTDRITLDENATTSPMARSGVNVKVKRTIKAGEWSTICLPFTMTKAQADAAFGTGCVVKQYKDYTATIDENTLIPSAITLNFADYTLNALRKLNAGTPYLIKTTQNIESFDVDGVTISTELSDVSGTETNYGLVGKFKGTLAKTKVPDKGLFISGNKFYYSTGETTMKAFRGWFDLEAVYNEAVGAPVYLSFDDEATGISGVKRMRDEGNNHIYNIKGQRVETPSKGLYIKNGKKVVVK